MDIVSQLQDQVDHIASLLFNHVGSLQRDAPPAPLGKTGKPQKSAEGVPQPEPLAAAVVQAARVLDELIAACPPTAQGAEAQLARIEELQDESDRLGEEIAREIEGAEADREIIDAMFISITDNCLPVALKVAIVPQTSLLDEDGPLDTRLGMDEDLAPG